MTKPFLLITTGALLALAGCAIDMGFDSAGKSCIGFGCGSHYSSKASSTGPATKSEDQIASIVLRNTTTFDKSVKPAVDNFLARYRSDPNNAQITRWIDDFFGPARRILGEEFEFEPTVTLKVNPDESAIYVAITQVEWREVIPGNPGFQRFVESVQTAGETLTAIRWRVDIRSRITPTSDTAIEYVTFVLLHLEKRRSKDQPFERAQSLNLAALAGFANRLSGSLTRDYREYFESRYGLKAVAAR